jgi:hypothetical protein
MKLFNGLLLTITILGISYGCAQQKDKKNSEEATTLVSPDSIELLALTKNLLKWHEADLKEDFPPMSDNDSIYTGIDWPAHKARMEELSKINFFTQEFMDNYQKIALQLDKELKQNPVKYYKGELPPYGNDANEWCNCQDYPSDIWKRLMIKNIKLEKDIASYYWTWGNDLNYFVKAKKENGHWKITYLERFDVKNYTWK